MAKNTSKLLHEKKGERVQLWQTPIVEGSADFDNYGEVQKGPLTAEKIEAIQRMAYQEAYEEGLKKGLKEGLQKAQKEAKKQLDVLAEMLHALSRPLDNLDQTVEEQLVQLAVLIARQLVKRELRQDPGEIIGIIRDAVGLLPVAAQSVIIHLHQDDLSVVQRSLSALAGDNHWQLRDDPNLNSGDCRITTDTSTIDATLENRLTAVIVSMLGGVRATDEAVRATEEQVTER